MANTTNTTITVPNERFAASFLNTKYRDRAVPDEVLMDKTTGSLVYKRLDGSFMCYDRENIDILEIANKLHSVYVNDKTAIYPTKINSNDYENTHLMGVQYDLQSFSYKESFLTRFEDGAVLENNINTAFSISHEMNGFFIKAVASPRDVSLINLLSSVCDRYFRTYEGDKEAFLAIKNLLKTNPLYQGSNVEIGYTLRYYKNEVLSKEISGIGYGKIQEISYIPFSDLEIKSYEEAEYITLSIDSITLPKVKYGYVIKEEHFTNEELELYEKIKDLNDISLKYLDVYTFTTITDIPYIVPNKENSRINLYLRMNVVERLFSETVTGNLLQVIDRLEELEEVTGVSSTDKKVLVGIYDKENEKFYEDLGDGNYKIYNVLETDADGNPSKLEDTGKIISKEELPENLKKEEKTEIKVPVIEQEKIVGIYDEPNKKFYEELGDGTYKVYDVLETDEDGNPIKLRDTGTIINGSDLPSGLSKDTITISATKESSTNTTSTDATKTLMERLDALEKLLGITTTPSNGLTGIYDEVNNKFYEDLGNGTYKIYDVIEKDASGKPIKLKDTGLVISSSKLPSELSGKESTTVVVKEIESSSETIIDRTEKTEERVTSLEERVTELENSRVVIGPTPPASVKITWIDTSAGGVYKYWDGTKWTPIKSVWG